MASRWTWKKADRVLDRVGQFVQIGLFVVAIVGFKFTVIPLYEKAMVDESLARSQLVLTKVEDKLAASYARIRYASVREFVLIVGPDCSGLTIPPEVPALIMGQQQSGFDELVLDNSIAECFNKYLMKDSGLRELSADDRIRFENELRALGKKLDSKRFELRDRHMMASEQERIFVALAFGTDIRKAVLELANLKWD